MNPLNHVAIIMDGNGRWGLKYRNSRNIGHKEGLKTVETIIKSSIKNKINDSESEYFNISLISIKQYEYLLSVWTQINPDGLTVGAKPNRQYSLSFVIQVIEMQKLAKKKS